MICEQSHPTLSAQWSNGATGHKNNATTPIFVYQGRATTGLQYSVEYFVTSTQGRLRVLLHRLDRAGHLIWPPHPSLTQPQSNELHVFGVQLHTSAGRSPQTFVVSSVAAHDNVPPTVFPRMLQLCGVPVQAPAHLIDGCFPSWHRTEHVAFPATHDTVNTRISVAKSSRRVMANLHDRMSLCL